MKRIVKKSALAVVCGLSLCSLTSNAGSLPSASTWSAFNANSGCVVGGIINVSSKTLVNYPQNFNR